MNLILFGPPGAGKGTQADFLSKRLGVPTISTGAMIRDAIEQQTEFGKSVQESIANGNLIPDEIMIAMIKDRIEAPDCKNGFILDGFPRTIAQGEEIYRMQLPIDKVLFLTVEDDVIVKRLKDRRECPSCRASYHMIDHPPKKAGICDRCGHALVTRKDDTPDAIANRLAIYHRETEPLMEFFREKGILVTVESQTEIAQTKRMVAEALGVPYDND